MAFSRSELEGLDRESLVARAQDAGIRRARILTRPELIDELLRNDPNADEKELKKSRGFFGRARDLVARVVERGLHLPDAADRIRTLGTLPPSVPRTEPQAVPTVTLAEIYAAQGHPKRAIATLKAVLDREPDHVAAKSLLSRLQDDDYVPPPQPLPPEPDVEPEPLVEDPPDEDTAILSEPPRPVPELSDENAEDAPTVMTSRKDLRDESEDEPTQYWRGSKRRGSGPAPATEDAPDKETVDTRSLDQLLADYVDEPTRHLGGEGNGAPKSRGANEPVDAPTRVLPKKSGQTYAVTPAGTSRARPVDVHADTDAASLSAATAPLPSECVALPIGEGRTFIRWMVHGRPARAKSLVLRAHVIVPSWDGPTSEVRDVPIDVDDGEAILRGAPERAVVRVAVGFFEAAKNKAAAFVPLAHSAAIEIAPGRGLVRWSIAGFSPVALDDPRAAFLARAAHAARRAAQV